MSWSSKTYTAQRWSDPDWIGYLVSELSAYPAISVVPRRTRVTRVPTESVDAAIDGTVRVFDSTDIAAFRLRVEHPHITTAQAVVLNAYYARWGGETILIDDVDGNLYSCKLPLDLDDVNPVSSAYRHASVTMQGNRVV